MNYYPFHIGDYLSHTAHLEPMEDLAYRRMIDLYFVREACLPADPAAVAKLIRLRDHMEAVESVLAEFFVKTDAGWVNDRCEYEIGEAQSKRSKAKESAAKRWNSEGNANAMPSHAEGNAPNPNPNPNPNPKVDKTISGYPEAFDAIWDAYPKRPGASKRDAFRAWSARLKAGVDEQSMLDGVLRYSAYCRAAGTDPQYIKQATTFLGPNEHYLSDWTPPARATSPPYESEKDRSRREAYEVLTGRKPNERDDQCRTIDAVAERLG